jgi:hypothetical protein
MSRIGHRAMFQEVGARFGEDCFAMWSAMLLTRRIIAGSEAADQAQTAVKLDVTLVRRVYQPAAVRLEMVAVGYVVARWR